MTSCQNFKQLYATGNDKNSKWSTRIQLSKKISHSFSTRIQHKTQQLTNTLPQTDNHSLQEQATCYN